MKGANKYGARLRDCVGQTPVQRASHRQSLVRVVRIYNCHYAIYDSFAPTPSPFPKPPKRRSRKKDALQQLMQYECHTYQRHGRVGNQ